MFRPEHQIGLAALGGALLLSGCMTFNPFVPPADRVGAALNDHHYRDALAIIDTTGERHPQHALLSEQREGVIQASQEYRREALTQAEELASREQWSQAYRVLEAIRDRVVDPAPVDATLKALERRHDERLRDLLNQAYLAEAQALLRSERVDQALLPYSGPGARETLQRRTQRRNLLYRHLLEQGNAYAGAAHWQQALESLETAQRLRPDAPIPDALAEARRTLHGARDRARHLRERAQRQQAEALLDRYRSSGKLADLLAARTFIRQHSDADHLTALREQVNDWARLRFQRAMTRGEALYAEGDYRAAHQLWQSIAPLDPDDPELRKKLTRSAKVLDNLRALED